ncbi:hypothetical protein [uncultured Parasutterella sp.]|jgi:hypothetical protein|uniref:hypothetical protein n=1 Tax=uncultured Parasutterella sp. TaxID=1263098 RepID=UPI002047DE3D|nr:hypothetical protein [uncultured Parasutterella sp.]DAJ56243.1 MAG TPA: hypothetical protein [Caudoviricetes sp.]
MRYLGVFDERLSWDAEVGDFFFLKMVSPIYDRYELWEMRQYPSGVRVSRVYNDTHGLITCFHRKGQDDVIQATTLFSRYSKRKSFTADCGTIQNAFDLIIENYLRHATASQIPSDSSCFWEPLVYNGKGFFNFTVGAYYYSGYRTHTGLVYAKDDMGKSVLSKEKMTMEEVVGYFRTLAKLGKFRRNK